MDFKKFISNICYQSLNRSINWYVYEAFKFVYLSLKMARLQPDNTDRHRRIQWAITARYIVSNLFLNISSLLWMNFRPCSPFI